MDRNWNRGGGGGGGVEKFYRQSYSGGGHHSHHNQHQQPHYRKKNDFSGPEYYIKTAKPIAQSLKKESLQVALFEDELMDVNFSWIKNT
jgi:hypothetical protein